MRSLYLAALSGALAAAVALGVAELAAGLLGVSSLVVAVGSVIVDNTPGPLVKAAIEVLGTLDKPALVATVSATAVLIGALLGPRVASRPGAALLAFAAFGLVGFAAGALDAAGTLLADAFVAGIAAASGFGAFRLLVTAIPGSSTGARVQVPGRGTGSRRRFLALAGGTAGTAALAALTGRLAIGEAVDVEAQRRALALPGGETPISEAGGLDVPGLSPIIVPNDSFYRIDKSLVVPRIDLASWRLRVTGMVERPFEITFSELLAMPLIEDSVTLACVSNEVGGELVGNAIWRGVPLAEILDRAGVRAGATQVVGRSVDGFTTGFPTEAAFDGRTSMVAIAMNGEPLPAAHGFPARLVVAGLYGYVSATKWLTEIELTTLDAFDAYWVPRGWAKQAPIKTQSRIDVPRSGQTIRAGATPIAGVAWGGIRGIERVEVRVRTRGDTGSGTWREARLGEALSRASWRQWVLDWSPAPGEYRIDVRATDGEGATQPEARRPPAPDGATGWHTVTVRVA